MIVFRTVKDALDDPGKTGVNGGGGAAGLSCILHFANQIRIQNAT